MNDKGDRRENIYDLRCVMYHSGNLEYGHYYSICYNTIKNGWYKYNDDKVEEINENDISHKDAYVLFYRKRGLENFLDMEKAYQANYKDYTDKIKNIINS